MFLFKTKINQVNKDKEGRMLKVQADLFEYPLTLINIYAPNTDDPQFYRNLFLESSQIHGQCIIGGDINLILNPCLDKSNNSHVSLSKAATALKEGMKDFGYLDIWRVRNPNERDYSYYSHVHDVYTRIDLFLIASSLELNVQACEYLPRTLSDHSPVKMKLTINHKIFPKKWKLHPHLLKDPLFDKFIAKEIIDL